MQIEPIGFFRALQHYPYDAARQGALAPETRGEVVLERGRNFEQALQDLDGFSHIWLLFQFHQNERWKPVVQPPRGHRKVGVFACRAPYRPNPIGLSCVELLRVDGLRIEVRGHDLLDGTPILDIKPYLAYADSVPGATRGWLDEIEDARWGVSCSPEASVQLDWLEAQGAGCVRDFLVQQLSERPLDTKKKRLTRLEANAWEIAYRTWRIRFSPCPETHRIEIESVRSGYTPQEIREEDDPYRDKDLHAAFRTRFPS